MLTPPTSEIGPNEPILPDYTWANSHSQIYSHIRGKFGHDRTCRFGFKDRHAHTRTHTKVRHCTGYCTLFCEKIVPIQRITCFPDFQPAINCDYRKSGHATLGGLIQQAQHSHCQCLSTCRHQRLKRLGPECSNDFARGPN